MSRPEAAYSLPPGEIEVDAVIPIQLADLTPALAASLGSATSTICSQSPSTAAARACSSSTSTTCRRSGDAVISRRTAWQTREQPVALSVGAAVGSERPRTARLRVHAASRLLETVRWPGCPGQPLVTPTPGACRSGLRSHRARPAVPLHRLDPLGVEVAGGDALWHDHAPCLGDSLRISAWSMASRRTQTQLYRTSPAPACGTCSARSMSAARHSLGKAKPRSSRRARKPRRRSCRPGT